MPLLIRPAHYLDTFDVGKVLSRTFYPWGGWMHRVIDFLVATDVQSRFLENSPHYLCLVAVVAPGHVVATLEVGIRCVAQGKAPYIFNFAVHPQWRRKGIGSQLLTAVESHIRSWEFSHLYLHVLADNWAAQQLYLRLGYQCWQTEKRWMRNSRLLYRKSL